MTTLEYSAHHLVRTRFCVAADCPEESLTRLLLCSRHERHRLAGKHIRLHPITTQPEPVLCCGKCHRWKPDDEFPPAHGRIGGPVRDRRGKSYACIACHTRLQIQAFNERRDA